MYKRNILLLNLLVMQSALHCMDATPEATGQIINQSSKPISFNIKELREFLNQMSNQNVNVDVVITDAQPANVEIMPSVPVPPVKAIQPEVPQKKWFSFNILSKEQLLKYGPTAVAIITVCAVSYILYKNGTLVRLGEQMQAHPYITAASVTGLTIAGYIAGYLATAYYFKNKISV